MKGCPWKGQLVELTNHLKLCDENIIYLQVKKSQSDFIGSENVQASESFANNKTECVLKTPNLKELLKKRVFPKTAINKKTNDIEVSSSLKEHNKDDDNDNNNIKRNVFKMLFEFNKDFEVTNVPQLKSEQKSQIERIFHISKA